jgi:hypothetical protein
MSPAANYDLCRERSPLSAVLIKLGNRSRCIWIAEFCLGNEPLY